MSAPALLRNLHWLGHDSFRLDGPPVIYFDPWKLSGHPPLADLVLVSHEHGDHCSPADVKKVSGAHTTVIANPTAAAQLPGARVLRPGEKITVGLVTVEAVPAYNLTKFRSPGHPFHPKPAEHNGYIVTVGGERLYHAGDTDHIPDMSGLKCDVALLPVSGTYVMTADEAAQAARSIQPRVAVPMHWGDQDVVGTLADAEKFERLCQQAGIGVAVLRRSQSPGGETA
jgi:L-ascorbate metabolism protein UlaG (beta-lactamase superfamily)